MLHQRAAVPQGHRLPRPLGRIRRSRWSVVATVVAVAAGLAGCGNGASAAPEQEPSGALTVVVGARANMPAPEPAGRSASTIDLAVAQQSRLSVIVADGAPFEAATAGPLPEGGRQVVQEAIGGARARTPESDLLGALALAAESLAGQRGLRNLVVLDSGLSTTGALNFTVPGMLEAHPQEVADGLGDAQLLPDLTGVNVVFHGLGDTVDPQQPLDSMRRAQLAAIWTAVAEQAGAVSVYVERAPLGSAPVAEVPPVTTVGTPPGYQCAGTRMTITGGPFTYRPNSDDFVDPSAATNALRGIADQLRAGRIVATIFGTTATAGAVADQLRFSDERAQALADLLIELGVPIPQLRVEGLGSDFPGFVEDRDAQGRLLPAAAALNRTVFVQFSAPVTCG